MAEEVWSNVGHREYKPGIDHGTLYVRPETNMPKQRAPQDMEWDIDRNLPVYTRDLVELSGRWTPDGQHTLRELIEDFAVDGLGVPGRDTGAKPVAPDDGESRPPTPSSRVATDYPDGNFPQLWSSNYIKRIIREEIQEAFAQRVRERNAAWNRTREGED